jgi:hypothetical protein
MPTPVSYVSTKPLSSFASTVSSSFFSVFSSFLSPVQNERFVPLEKKRDPGPGQYNVEVDWVRPARRVQPNVSERAKVSASILLRSDSSWLDASSLQSDGLISPFATSPSIPAKGQSTGYDDSPRLSFLHRFWPFVPSRGSFRWWVRAAQSCGAGIHRAGPRRCLLFFFFLNHTTRLSVSLAWPWGI